MFIPYVSWQVMLEVHSAFYRSSKLWKASDSVVEHLGVPIGAPSFAYSRLMSHDIFSYLLSSQFHILSKSICFMIRVVMSQLELKNLFYKNWVYKLFKSFDPNATLLHRPSNSCSFGAMPQRSNNWLDLSQLQICMVQIQQSKKIHGVGCNLMSTCWQTQNYAKFDLKNNQCLILRSIISSRPGP